MTAPEIAVVDTSVILAAYNRKDQHHERGIDALNAPQFLIISPLVLAELDHMLHVQVGEAEAINAVTRIGALASQNTVRLPRVDRVLLAEAEHLMTTYSDPGAGSGPPRHARAPKRVSDHRR